MNETFSSLLDRFIAVTRKVRTARRGEEILVIKEPLMGYEGTAIEGELYQACSELANALKATPVLLTGDVLESLCRGLIDAACAVDEYRARLMRYAGDYGDERSNGCYAVKTLIDGIQTALLAQEAQDAFPLEAVSRELLLTPVQLCAYESVYTQELYRFILTDAMRVGERPLFLEFAVADQRKAREKIVELQAASDHDMTYLMRELACLAWHVKGAILDEVARAYIGQLGNRAFDVWYEATEQLQRLGHRAVRELMGALQARSIPVVRVRLVTVLGKIAEETYHSELKPEIYRALLPLQSEKDPELRKAVDAALRASRPEG